MRERKRERLQKQTCSFAPLERPLANPKHASRASEFLVSLEGSMGLLQGLSTAGATGQQKLSLVMFSRDSCGHPARGPSQPLPFTYTGARQSTCVLPKLGKPCLRSLSGEETEPQAQGGSEVSQRLVLSWAAPINPHKVHLAGRQLPPSWRAASSARPRGLVVIGGGDKVGAGWNWLYGDERETYSHPVEKWWGPVERTPERRGCSRFPGVLLSKYHNGLSPGPWAFSWDPRIGGRIKCS